MPGYTAKLALPYPLGSESVGSIDDTLQALTARLEVVLPFTFTTGPLTIASAATNYSQRVNYPAGKALPSGVVPTIQLTAETSNPNSVTVTASAIDNTGFTVNWRRETGTANIPLVHVTVQRVA